MPPHLVIVVADTWRRPESLPGSTLASTMPFLSGLAPGGREIPGLVASSSWTLPSHLALLCGLDPTESGRVLSAPSSAPPSLASAWRNAGGESVALSANYLVQPSTGLGADFDEFNPGAPFELSGRLVRAWQSGGYEHRLYEALEAYRSAPGDRRARWQARTLWGLGKALYGTARLLYDGDTVARSLERYLRRRRSPAPLQLFVNLLETHEPYRSVGSARWPDWGEIPCVGLCQHSGNLASVSARDSAQRAYQGALGALDRSLAGLFRTLGKGGVLNDALVLLVSDHGQSLGEHGFYGHGYYLFDELVRIPGYLWAFQNGRATSLPEVPAGPWDHRHLWSVLSDFVGGERIGPETWERARHRMGSAFSYVEGVAPHPPGSFRRTPERGEISSQRRDFGPLPPEPRPFALPPSPLPSGPAGPGWPVAGNLLDPGVEDRLRTWGYL